jgi:SCY1-like protein 2
MDVINKFRSTVTNTMSQLSTVLPGNPVTREYEATKHIASAGIGVYIYFVFCIITQSIIHV